MIDVRLGWTASSIPFTQQNKTKTVQFSGTGKCESDRNETLTLCAEDTSGWLYVANGVETGSTLANGVVTNLHAEGVLVVVDAGLIVEALLPQLFGYLR